MIVGSLSSWILPAQSQVWRERPRPSEQRQSDYDNKFEFNTIWYDAFRSHIDDSVIAIAPPPLNLAQPLGESSFRLDGAARPLCLRAFDRNARLWWSGIPAARTLAVEGPLGNLECPVGENLSRLFAGRRVLMTVSKDNRLDWIRDWLRFNVQVHGADAVLFYDNLSGAYPLEQLQATLAAVPGIRQAVVVRWPFKWGPGGTTGDNWDSNFSQLGAWEHARWRFLQNASSVLNSDIDELVLSDDGRSVFEAVENSQTGYIRYMGYWVTSITRRTVDWPNRRHLDFDVVCRPGVLDCDGKWAVVPHKCSFSAQWNAHFVVAMDSDEVAASGFSYRHFQSISNSWKYDREFVPDFDPGQHAQDDSMRELLRRVLG